MRHLHESSGDHVPWFPQNRLEYFLHLQLDQWPLSVADLVSHPKRHWEVIFYFSLAYFDQDPSDQWIVITGTLDTLCELVPIALITSRGTIRWDLFPNGPREVLHSLHQGSPAGIGVEDSSVIQLLDLIRRDEFHTRLPITLLCSKELSPSIYFWSSRPTTQSNSM